MKVLIVNKLYYPWIGGVETVVQQLAEGLPLGDGGIQTEVLCCRPKGRTVKEKINNVEIVRASSFGIFKSMPISLSFFGLFKKMSAECDVVDLHHPFPLSFLAYYLFKPKAKLLVHYHSDIIRQKVFGFLLLPFIKFVLRRADKVIVSNPGLVKNSKILDEFREKCVVIPFGVDVKEIDNLADTDLVDKIREKYGNFILYAGRLSYYKGVQYLLEAMKNVPNNLVIIGNGEEKDRLKNLVDILGIKDRVFFLDHLSRKELINFYKAATVFVLPSIFKSETFGITLLEAMACGTPVISTELGTGTSFVNQSGVTGLVVPPRSIEALKGALLEVLDNGLGRGRFGSEARLRAETIFALTRMISDNAQIVF